MAIWVDCTDCIGTQEFQLEDNNDRKANLSEMNCFFVAKHLRSQYCTSYLHQDPEENKTQNQSDDRSSLREAETRANSQALSVQLLGFSIQGAAVQPPCQLVHAVCSGHVLVRAGAKLPEPKLQKGQDGIRIGRCIPHFPALGGAQCIKGHRYEPSSATTREEWWGWILTSARRPGKESVPKS